MMSVNHLPVRRSISITQTVDWLVAGHGQYTVDGAVVRSRVIDGDRNNLGIRWPQRWRFNCRSTDHRKLRVVDGDVKRTRCSCAVQPGVSKRDRSSADREEVTGVMI